MLYQVVHYTICVTNELLFQVSRFVNDCLTEYFRNASYRDKILLLISDVAPLYDKNWQSIKYILFKYGSYKPLVLHTD